MKYLIIIFLAVVHLGCDTKQSKENTNAPTTADGKKYDTSENKSEKIRIIIDTDANNELDDQHALAYAISNQDVFDIEGITINRTKYGDGIEGHYNEAVRILNMYNSFPEIKVIKGASGNYVNIRKNLNNASYDGKDAVEFIIERAKANDDRQLVLVPVGKLTNIALALEKAPEIAQNIRIVWLGSNYPKPGEYNLENDTTSVNPVIESGAPFEVALVRYGETSGTAAVAVTPETINEKMPGKGVKADKPVKGRHGGEFSNFGDYSVNLFENAEMHGDPPSRPLYDMAAVAIIKNPNWAERVEIPAPRLAGKGWIEKPENDKKIIIWEEFEKDAILNDFFESIENPDLGK